MAVGVRQKSPTSTFRFARHRSFFAILVTACAVRALYLVFFLRSPFNGVYRIDQLYYRSWGLKIAAGDWIGREVFEQGPLYAYLLGLFYRLAGPRDTWILILQLLAGVLTVGLIWDLTRRLFGLRAAAVSGALAALYGPAVFYECALMKTFLEPLFVLAALSAAVRAPASRRPAGWWVAAGAAVGLASLVREVHLLLLVPLAIAASRPWVADAEWRPRLQRAFIPVASCILMILPATLRNFAITGEFVAISAAGGENFYLAYGPYAKGYYARPPFLRAAPYQEHQDFRDELFLRTGTPHSRGDCSRYWFRQGLTSALEHPGRSLWLAWQKTRLLFNDFEFPDNENYPVSRELIAPLRWLPTFGCVVGLGLLGMARAALRLRRHLLPLGFTLVLTLGVLLTFNIGRYRAAFVPLLLIFSGRAVVGLLTAVRRGSYANAAGAGLVTLAFSSVAFLPAPGLAPASREREFGIFRKDTAEAAAARARISPLEAALKANPTNQVLWITYGATLEQTGRLPEAREAYLKVARVAPGLAEARFALARLLLRQGELAAAAIEAHAAIALDPRHARSHLLLGRIRLWEASGAPDSQEARRAVEEAAGYLQRAIEADRGLAEAYAKLGRAYFLLGAPRQALEILNVGRRIDPSSVESRYLRDFIHGRRDSTN